MNKHFETFHELHHTHKMTHKILTLVIFSVIIILAVYGLQKVNASLSLYALVPNGPANVCYKVDLDYKDLANHISCTTHEKVCQTPYGIFVGCNSRRPIDFN